MPNAAGESRKTETRKQDHRPSSTEVTGGAGQRSRARVTSLSQEDRGEDLEAAGTQFLPGGLL